MEIKVFAVVFVSILLFANLVSLASGGPLDLTKSLNEKITGASGDESAISEIRINKLKGKTIIRVQKHDSDDIVFPEELDTEAEKPIPLTPVRSAIPSEPGNIGGTKVPTTTTTTTTTTTATTLDPLVTEDVDIFKGDCQSDQDC